MDLGSEVGELLDHFRWLTEADSYHPEKIEKIKDEIGDVYLALISLADKLGVDPLKSAKDKLEKLGKKYPVELSKGNCCKHTDLIERL